MSQNLTDSIIKKLALSRHLFFIARQNIESSQDLALFSGINLLQDSVEVFFLALSEYTSANIKQNASFAEYFDKINLKIKPHELPFKNRLIALNKIRVNAKHYGIQPNREECKICLIAVHEFLESQSKETLNVSYWSISLVDLIEDVSIANLLKLAEEFLEEEKFFECLISCRKAIFYKVEKQYDIRPFDRDDIPKTIIGGRPFSNAPFHAKNKQYIEKYVETPENYIVFDYQHLYQYLMEYEINPTDFWNIRRLTPAVYQKDNDSPWSVIYEDPILKESEFQKDAEYILTTVTNIILNIQSKEKKEKRAGTGKVRHLILKKEKVPVYVKTDKKGKVFAYTSEGVKKLFTSQTVTIGFDGEGPYHRIISFKAPFLFGFVHGEFVEDIIEGIPLELMPLGYSENTGIEIDTENDKDDMQS